MPSSQGPGRMTAEQRARLYCCFKACPSCGAQRGEFCKAGRGRTIGAKWHHWERGPYAGWPRMTPALRERYAKLKAQILAESPRVRTLEWTEALIALRDPLSLVPTPPRSEPFLNAPWGGMRDRRGPAGNDL